MELLETVLEIKIYYVIITILLHVSLQTLVNHFHHMRADREHTAQLNAVLKQQDLMFRELTHKNDFKGH